MNYEAGYTISKSRLLPGLSFIAGSILVVLLSVGSAGAFEATDTSITINWIATGDDGLIGRASFYDLRIDTVYLDSARWKDHARRVTGVPPPQAPGTPESFKIDSLKPNTTYWIGLKVGDEIPNWSDTSNILRVLTDPTLAVSVDDSNGQVSPFKFQLNQNYPNPFNPATVISYEIGRSQRVQIVVYNILGQEVDQLIDRQMPAGRHEVTWYGLDNSGRQAVSGIYFYRIRAGELIQTRKMVLLR